jgi:hypothetical protein
MTVDFRSGVLSKGNAEEDAAETQVSRHSPATFLLAVLFAVASGLCAVAWVWW